MVARDHHTPHDSDNDNDNGATVAREEAVVGELREPLSLCYAAADKVTTDSPLTHLSVHLIAHHYTLSLLLDFSQDMHLINTSFLLPHISP